MRRILTASIIALSLYALFGCSVTGGLARRQTSARLTQLTRSQRQIQQADMRPQVVTLRRDSTTLYFAPADTLDGERVMSLNIEQVTVVAAVRTLPERMGKVTIDFIVDLPKELLGRSQSVVITPFLHKFGEAVALEDLTIRGPMFDKLQQRDYWQYDTYLWRYAPDSTRAEQLFNRFVKFPRPADARLDSLVEYRSHITYYYSQEVPTDETSKKMLVTLQGKVTGMDASLYTMPSSDTLTYMVSSMLSFVDTLPRYRIKVVDKYVTVNDRNYIQFRTNDARVVDTLGDNGRQLDKITVLMAQLVGQEEFYVDTITLTASSSPEGHYARNNALARERAQALKHYLTRRYGRSIDTMLTVKWIAEDWDALTARVKGDQKIRHRDEILALIRSEKNPDKREAEMQRRFPADYAYIRERIYPYLRAVTFRYDLRRVGMVKDTIHTTELDTTYARGVELLQDRKYAKALYVLNDYNDRNTVVAHLSLGHDAQALELLQVLPEDAITAYLQAIACSRLGRKEEGRAHFLEACRRDPRMEYRGNLDPEITELLKQ